MLELPTSRAMLTTARPSCFSYIIVAACSAETCRLLYVFSPLGKLAGRAIYFACVNFFFFFLSFFTMSKAISVSTGPIFTIFSPNGRYLCNFLDQVQFFRFLKGRCHGNQFSGKNGAKLSTPCTYRSVIPKRNKIWLPQCAC